MRDDDAIDLSALDAARDAARWQRYVDATLSRADAALLRRREDPLQLIVGWSRPLLLAAAALIALLVPVELMLELREPRAEQIERLVTLSTEWHEPRRAPSGADFLQALALEPLP